MDFFASQEKAQRKTSLLVVFFVLAVMTIIVGVYYAVMVSWNTIVFLNSDDLGTEFYSWWDPYVFTAVTVFTLIIVVGGSLVEVLSLQRSGGTKVAESMGGRKVMPNTDEAEERELLNVVEEMAIASGVPAPPVYVMDGEDSINAFAAGYNPSDAVIAVTHGLLHFLDRDETQGVIGHEFSHILNGDMRMNIHLMGTLHGIVMIHIIGKSVLRGMRHARRASAYLLLVGGSLWLVGYLGVFVGKFIKSAISREREYLADASSVQFTRNPAGLSGALQKIGALAYGGRMSSPRAEDASHMFFGNALRTEFSSLATHPPVVERIRRIDPQFDGVFPKLRSLQSIRVQKARQFREDKVVSSIRSATESAADAPVAEMADSLAGISAESVEPEMLMRAIGAPLASHILLAQTLLDEMPGQIRRTAREPCGARAIVYALLLDDDPEIRRTQKEILERDADADVLEETSRLAPELEQLQPEAILPLVDLLTPALKALSPPQYWLFRDNVNGLIEADEEIDLFEYALTRSLLRNLDAFFVKPNTKPAQIYSIRGVGYECSVVLSMLARIGHDDEEQSQKAFQLALAQLHSPRARIEFLRADDCSLADFDQALDRLAKTGLRVKKWIVAAALQCLVFDGRITIEEAELFRAISYALDCPVSPAMLK